MILFPLYDLILGAFALSYFPRMLINMNVKERLRGITLSKFGLKLPKKIPEDAHVIWIHAVSVGEVKAASTIEPLLRRQYPQSHLVVSTSTKTGLKQAEKSFSSMNDCFILPLDFFWVAHRLMKRLHPNLLLFSEGDLWPRLAAETKKWGTKTAIINARLSKVSLKRYRLIPKPFRFYQLIDQFCCQNEEYYQRFLELGVPENKLTLSGNLKFDLQIQMKDHPLFAKLKKGKILSLISTHENEEKIILTHIREWLKQHTDVEVVIAPRHIQRAEKIREELQELDLHFSISSSTKAENRFWILDAMGIVPSLCDLSFAAIIGGSFVPIGGHDIIEPIKAGTIPIFGPYMNKQEHMKELVLAENVGIQTKADLLARHLSLLLEKKGGAKDAQEQKNHFLRKIEGASERTWKKIEEMLEA